MKFDNFEIHAIPEIINAYCRECHNALKVISDGWFSKALFCPHCITIYQIKMIKVQNDKIDKEYLEKLIKNYTK